MTIQTNNTCARRPLAVPAALMVFFAFFLATPIQSQAQTLAYEQGEANLEEMQKDADKGIAWAQFQLGSLYFHGTGVPQNYSRAEHYLQKAADQGHDTAAILLANMYLNGQGLDKNEQKSFSLIHAAAWRGLPSAQAMLGTYYCEGIGADKNLSRCAAWLDVAAAQGVREAQQDLARTVQSMTPAQINKATALSKQFWQKIVEQR